MRVSRCFSCRRGSETKPCLQKNHDMSVAIRSRTRTSHGVGVGALARPDGTPRETKRIPHAKLLAAPRGRARSRARLARCARRAMR